MTRNHRIVRQSLLGAVIFILMCTASLEGRAQVTVRYQDKTTQTGLTLEDDPIDSGMVEGSGDGLLDLQFHYDSRNADFFESDSILNGVPQWNKHTSLFYAPGEIPGPGSTATATLDYDNDGIMDLFMGSDSGGRLYRGTGSSFTEVTADVSGSGVLFGHDDGAITVGDYDGDGWTDLVAARGDKVYLQQNLGVDGNGQHLGFDIWAGYLTTENADPGAIAFLDVEGDGNFDLFVGDASGGLQGLGKVTRNTLLINQGGDPVSWTWGTLPQTLLIGDLQISDVDVADILPDSNGLLPRSGSRRGQS